MGLVPPAGTPSRPGHERRNRPRRHHDPERDARALVPRRPWPSTPPATACTSPTRRWSWRRRGATPARPRIALTGALTNHTGPAGPTYTIPDGAAATAPSPSAARGSCGSSDCYSVANTAATRPATHWDSTAVETVTPTATTKTWTLHVGDSFTDVPPSSGFYRFIETILHKNVTGGCTHRHVLPDQLDDPRPDGGLRPRVQGSRRLRAARLRRRTPMFADVPVDQPLLPLDRRAGPARRGRGCGGGNYCPASSGDPRADGGLRAAHAGPDAQPARVRRRRCSPTFRRPAPSAAGSRSWPVAASSPAAAAATTAPTARSPASRWASSSRSTFGLTLYGLTTAARFLRGSDRR